MTIEKIKAEIEEGVRLASLASEGPWEWWENDNCLALSRTGSRDEFAAIMTLFRVEAQGDDEILSWLGPNELDRKFIADARTRLPRTLRMLKAAIEELEACPPSYAKGRILRAIEEATE